MVYDGTVVKTMLPETGVAKKTAVLYEAPDLDAAAEESPALNIMEDGFPFLPTCAVFLVTTVGTTAIIDITVQVSMDDVNYVESGLAVTAKNTYDFWPNANFSGAEDIIKKWIYWKFVVADEGTGNVNTAKLWLME